MVKLFCFRLAIIVCVCWLVAGGVGVANLAAAEPFRFPEGRYEKGRLRYVNGIPILTVGGSPEEIGSQIGVLALKPSLPLVARFRDYLKEKGLDKISPILFAASEKLYKRFPKEYRRELDAMIQASGADRNLVVLGNTAFDLELILLGCSGLLVGPDRSATHGTLYGRNFDFPLKDEIEQYSLVIVYRPTGKKAFAMVTFPGILASNCGMNQDGLTLGANTVSKSGDGAPAFNPDGMPYSVAAREVMETCGSVDDFDRWIRGHSRTGAGFSWCATRNFSGCTKSPRKTSASASRTTACSIAPIIIGLPRWPCRTRNAAAMKPWPRAATSSGFPSPTSPDCFTR